MPGWGVAPALRNQSVAPTAPVMPTVSGLPTVPSLSMGYGGNPRPSVVGGAGMTMGLVRNAFAGNMGAYRSPLDAAANIVRSGLTRGRTSTLLNSGGGEGFEEELRNTSRILLGR